MVSGQAAIRREERRQETFERIRDCGLRLVIAKGYEATTLEEIAAAAGITKRTFFYYFKSKDEVLLAAQGGEFVETIRAAFREASADQRPMVVVRNCLSKLISRYETKESVAIDRLLQSTEMLRARKQARFVEMEETIFESLCERWPGSERRKALRLVAMVSIGAMRVAIESWRENNGEHSLVEHLHESFEAIEKEIQA